MLSRGIVLPKYHQLAGRLAEIINARYPVFFEKQSLTFKGIKSPVRALFWPLQGITLKG